MQEYTGYTHHKAFDFAVFVNNTKVLKLLLEKFKEYCCTEDCTVKDLLLSDDDDNNTIVNNACDSGATECLTILLNEIKEEDDLKEILLKSNNKGNLPLHNACNQGATETVTVLLDVMQQNKELLETAILARNNDGHTAWYLATTEGKQETANTLLNRLPEELAEKLKR